MTLPPRVSVPKYKHDCGAGGCIFVGRDSSWKNEPQVGRVDMWVHPSPNGILKLIRRFSDRPSDYHCIMHSHGVMVPGRYARVLDKYRKHQLKQQESTT